MEFAMSRNQKDESPQRSDEPDQPKIRPDETVERDPLNPVPVQPPDAEPRPAERPDLDWAEHED
jgi:hypothetical protein